MIFLDETTIRLNTVKRLALNLGEKEKIVRIVKYSTNVNVWGYFSSQDFARIVYFKQNFNAALMSDVYKRDLLATVRKQFDLDSTIWVLQEDNDAKHT